MARVDLVGAGKSFGPVNVMDGVDLSMELGEFVVFVGTRRLTGREPRSAR